MQEKRVTIQFCGFGGQGIVLSSVIFGTAAVTRAGLNGIQTQSYGSEARGGECQAELTLARGAIHSPLADQVDILVAMSQSALDRYLGRLKPGATLIHDPELVVPPERSEGQTIQVPATAVASELGARIAANMVMLGFLQSATNLMSASELRETIREMVPEKYVDVNLRAAEEGMSLAQGQRIGLEI